MGNCQAVDAAALVIQHPNGKLERWYWPISVSEVMRMNPGHYVSLIIPLPMSSGEAQQQGGGSKDDTKPPPPSSQQQQQPQEKKTIRYTRVKLLRDTDTLVLGRAYRLVTSQEVMKVMRAKKYAKMKSEQESAQRSHVNHHERRSSTSGPEREARKQQLATTQPHRAMKNEREQSRTTQQQTTNPAAVGRSKSWRPSLQSISEATS